MRASGTAVFYLGVEEKFAPVRLREDVVVLEPDDGRQAQHFRAQHEHAEHGHQREHAYHFAVRLETCGKPVAELLGTVKIAINRGRPVC